MSSSFTFFHTCIVLTHTNSTTRDREQVHLLGRQQHIRLASSNDLNMKSLHDIRSRPCVMVGSLIWLLGMTNTVSPVNSFALQGGVVGSDRCYSSPSQVMALFGTVGKEDILKTTPTATKTGVQNKSVEERRRAAEVHARSIHNNDVMNALFVDVPERPDPIPCKIRNHSEKKDGYSSSLLPLDLPRGCLLRIGPNSPDTSMGFLDGDGMVHCITLPPTSSSDNDDDDDHSILYSSTYVQTKGRTLEAQANKNREYGDEEKVFLGTLGAAPKGLPMLASLLQNGLSFGTLDVQKDTCNTALAKSGERVLALMEQSPPSELAVSKDGKVRTLEAFCRLEGAVPPGPINGGSFGAHGRTDPKTLERIHVSYSSTDTPFVRVDTFDPNWKLKSSVGVDVPAPVMMHDCAITTNHVVLLDFPLTIRPRRFLRNAFPVEYEPSNGARIGLIPRTNKHNPPASGQWFEVESGVVLHAVNAYERVDDGCVVVHGFKSIPKGTSSYILDYTPAFLYEWILDTATGTCVQEGYLNPDLMVEFPATGDAQVGQPMGAVYGLVATTIGGPLHFKTPQVGVVLDGITKLALEADAAKNVAKGDVLGQYDLPSGWHMISEPTIVSKTGINSGHYVLGIATYVPEDRSCDYLTLAKEENSMKSRFLILDGDNISDGPVATIDLPHHMNYGLHSMFLDWEHMKTT